MSFVRNCQDNQSPTDAGGIGPAPQSILSERATSKVTTTLSTVAGTSVHNFSDNRSPQMETLQTPPSQLRQAVPQAPPTQSRGTKWLAGTRIEILRWIFEIEQLDWNRFASHGCTIHNLELGYGLAFIIPTRYSSGRCPSNNGQFQTLDIDPDKQEIEFSDDSRLNRV